LGKKYVNEPELWKETEEMVRKVLVDTNAPFIEVQDEAAFFMGQRLTCKFGRLSDVSLRWPLIRLILTLD
jgi:hypothetical protein